MTLRRRECWVSVKHFGDWDITSERRLITHDCGTLILRSEMPEFEVTAPVRVGNDIYVGMRAIVLPGVSIGNRCIIAAGSVVNRNTPDNSVATGGAATVLETTDQYLEKAKAKSLHFQHSSAKEKQTALMRHLGVRSRDS
jgi:acetyltransferase-like isoleucine patch superfamily enzyme